MQISMLTARDVKIRLKENWTSADFQAYYECTERELRMRMLQLYRKKEETVDDIFKRMQKNEKIRRKTSPAAKAAENARIREVIEATPMTFDHTDTILASLSPDVIVEISETQNTPENTYDKVDQDTESPAISVSFEEKISCLKERESELSKAVVALEVDWYAEKRRRTECLRSLRELERNLEAMRDSLVAQYDEYKRVIGESNDCADRMNAITGIRKEVRTELDAVRAELATFSKITVGVTIDGEIMLFDELDYRLDDSDHEEIFHKILEEDICSDLRLKDVRIVARLIAISKHLPVPMELVCDDEDVEAAFSLLVTSL